MDKEALRRQIHAELQTEFDAKLRETKKQKSRLEEELESESEKWRSERRRLNQEIDRLESALATARDTRRKTTKPEATRVPDTQELAKLQAAADERLKRAQREWDAERTKLETEIARLQQGVTELLERANNPLRANQAKKSQLETKLEDALRIKQQADEAFAASKADWEKERAKLAGEMVKLRRLAGAATRDAGPEDPRVKEMEKRLTESELQNAMLAAELDGARKNAALKQTQDVDEKNLIKERNEAREENKRLKRQLEEAQTAGRELTTLKKQLEQSKEAGKALEKNLEKAVASNSANDRSSELKQTQAELKQADATLKQAEAELTRAREQIEHQEQYIQSAKVALVESETKLQEATRERDRIAAELQKVRHQQEVQRGRSQESPAEAAAANGSGGPAAVGIPLDTAESELHRIEIKLEEISKLIDHPDTELSTVIRKNVERAELDAYLKGILFSLGRISGM